VDTPQDTVAVRLFDVEPASVRMDLIDSAAVTVHRIALRPAAVQLVVAYNVAAALNELQPQRANRFEEDDVATLGGCVVSDDQLTYVVLPAMGLFRGMAAEAAKIAHVAAHEAYHALIEQRGERVAGITARLSLSGPAEGFLAALAASLVEEFRVELAVHEAREVLSSPNCAAKLGSELVEAEGHMAETLALDQRRADEAKTYQETLQVIRRLLHRLAHVVAADVATDGETRPEITDLWSARIGEKYRKMRGVLESVRSARDAADLRTLDGDAVKLMPIVRAVLSSYWIELGDLNGELGVWCNRPL
jgi:hypothetical protein